ncbi:hypothetical protein, partial [Acetonema longum]
TVASSGTKTLETTADLLKDAQIYGNKVYVKPDVLNKVGAAEANGGSGFSGLAQTVTSSKPATWHGELTGGTQRIVQYSDSQGVKFIIHEVTDAVGNVVHRDFDAVRIASGQVINKMK